MRENERQQLLQKIVYEHKEEELNARIKELTLGGMSLLKSRETALLEIAGNCVTLDKMVMTPTQARQSVNSFLDLGGEDVRVDESANYTEDWKWAYKFSGLPKHLWSVLPTPGALAFAEFRRRDIKGFMQIGLDLKIICGEKGRKEGSIGDVERVLTAIRSSEEDSLLSLGS